MYFFYVAQNCLFNCSSFSLVQVDKLFLYVIHTRTILIKYSRTKKTSLKKQDTLLTYDIIRKTKPLKSNKLPTQCFFNQVQRNAYFIATQLYTWSIKFFTVTTNNNSWLLYNIFHQKISTSSFILSLVSRSMSTQPVTASPPTPGLGQPTWVSGACSSTPKFCLHTYF